MNFKQFLSAAASAAIMLTSVTAPNVTAETAVIELEPNTRVSVTLTDPVTTAAPVNVQYTTTTTVATILYMDGPEGTGAGPYAITVPAATFKSKKDLYDSKNNNKLRPNDGKYEVEVDRYDNIELYFSTDKKENVEIGATDISEPGEEQLCRYASVYDKEKEANKLVLHGDKPGTQDYYIEDYNGNSCIITVTVKDRELPRANRELRTKADEYGSNGTYFYNTDDDYIEITFTNAKDYVFANTITSGNSSADIYAGRGYDGTLYPSLGIDIKGVGTTQAYVVDTEGKSCIVTINVKEPVVTSTSRIDEARDTHTQTTYTDVVTSIWEGTIIETDPNSKETMILPITEVHTQYVPRASTTVTTTVRAVSTYWDGPEGTGAGPFILTEPDILTTPVGGYHTSPTTYPTTTTSPIGTGGWNPPPYMTTTAVSNVLIDLNNDKLIADTYDVTVDQYCNAEVYFKKESLAGAAGVFATGFDNEEIAECRSVTNIGGKFIDGMPTCKMIVHGKKPGTTKVLVQDKDGNACIINVTVNEKAPEANNRLGVLNADNDTIELWGNNGHYSGRAVFADSKTDYVFADILEGSDDLHFGMYTSASIQEISKFLEVTAYEEGIYKILLTDEKGQSIILTAAAKEQPREEPHEPVGTELPHYDGDTTTTTARPADGGEAGTAPQTTQGFVITSTTNTTPAPVSEEEENFGEPTFLGDADGSGDIGLADITTICKHLLNPKTFGFRSLAAKANADMNRDKKIDALDVSILIEINLGL